MDLLPDWAPNVHPLFVHFPIALVFVAVLVDALALLLARRLAWLRPVAVGLYVLAALGALAAFLTGRDAADSVLVPAEAQALLTEHADLGQWTAWLLGGYAVVRLAVWWWTRHEGRRLLEGVLLLAGLGAMALTWNTAEHGARLVFEHGVGVQAVSQDDDAMQRDHLMDHDTGALPAGPEIAANGAWRWAPRVPAALRDTTLQWLRGDGTTLQAHTSDAGDRGTRLALAPGTETAFFTAGPALEGVQADAVVNIADFAGVLQLVHHVQDARTYDFLEVEGTTMRLGRMIDGNRKVFDEKPFTADGWVRLRVVGDKTHFRGYAGDRLVTHGHADALPPGPVGLRLEGPGRLLLDRLDVQVTR